MEGAENQMAFKIGFATSSVEDTLRELEEELPETQHKSFPRQSIVKVRFIGRNTTLVYYNDLFDLHNGDVVYVDGKMEGLPGRVIDINYNFKIKRSDYRRVIALADSDVHGTFYMTLTHFISFDRHAVPRSKASTWFLAPVSQEDEYITGSNDTDYFSLDNLNGMRVSSAIAERGFDYFISNHVQYLCLDDTDGYAIVEGSDCNYYEVEFQYTSDGAVGGITCTCPCGYHCKHEYAVMLQLRELLDLIEAKYSDEYGRSNFVSIIYKEALFRYAVDWKESGSITL